MNHSVSINEITTIVSKALFAIGLPPGTDSENGKNIAWLEAHGLKGVSILLEEIQDLKIIERWPYPRITRTKECLTIYSPNPSGLLLAQTVVDFAETGKVILIKKCKAPLLIFAEAARRAKDTGGFQISWSVNNTFFKGVCDKNFVAINKIPQMSRQPIDVTVKAESQRTYANMLSLEKTYEISLRKGVRLDKCLWSELVDVAKGSLVPTNTHSRASAGAEVDDSN
jgi:hypothetical protein